MRKFSAWVLILLLVVFALPMAAIFALSLLEGGTFSLRQYAGLLANRDLLIRFGNSAVIALGTLAMQLPLAIGGGVFLARGRRWVRRIFLAALLAMLLLPFQSYMLPEFLLFRESGLYNTRLGLMLLGAFSPLGPLMVYAFMRTIPEEQWEAVRLDTSSLLRTLISVILPQMASALWMLLMLTFAEAWNLVEPAVILIANDKLLPVSTSLNDLRAVSWAGAAAYCLPVVVLYGVVCAAMRKHGLGEN